MDNPLESEKELDARLDREWRELLSRIEMRLKEFAGGQVEVTCGVTKTVRRGQIRSARLVGSTDCARKLVVMLDWYAEQQGDFTWVVKPSHQFTAGLLIYYDQIDQGVGRRIIFTTNARCMSELIVLYPMGDESLDPNLVTGLRVVS